MKIRFTNPFSQVLQPSDRRVSRFTPIEDVFGVYLIYGRVHPRATGQSTPLLYVGTSTKRSMSERFEKFFGGIETHSAASFIFWESDSGLRIPLGVADSAFKRYDFGFNTAGKREWWLEEIVPNLRFKSVVVEGRNPLVASRRLESAILNRFIRQFGDRPLLNFRGEDKWGRQPNSELEQRIDSWVAKNFEKIRSDENSYAVPWSNEAAA